ncbi:MAG: hypothetical protein NT029_16625 [Armatimonadetes bacterium]|nr:hypothetical protein [Armatimonadota bacterium]
MDRTAHSLVVGFVVAALLGPALGALGQAPLGMVGGAAAPPATPAWAQAPGLQREVTVAVHGEPLTTACERLSVASGVRLSCARSLGDQRVSLVAGPAPVGRLMLRLADALNHGRAPGRMVEWEVRGASDEPSYLLRRMPGSDAAHRAELDRPRATALRWLGALRAFGATGNADSPDGEDCPVMRDLRADSADSDAADARLAVQALGQAPPRTLAGLLGTGSALVDMPGPLGADGQPTLQTLRLNLAPGPGVGIYDLTLAVRQGSGGSVTETGYMLDTLGLGVPDPATIQAEEERDAASGPEVDLFREAGPNGGTAVTSLTTALRLWSRATGRSQVAEVFLKPRMPLGRTRGTPDQVLTAICRTFACDWRRVGDVTLVWSRTWAQDRDADVSAGQLAELAKRMMVGGKAAVRAFAEIGRLSDPQVETAARVLELPQLVGRTTAASVCRLLGALPESGLDRALAGERANLLLTAERLPTVARLMGRQPVPPVRLSVRIGTEGASCVVRISDQSGLPDAEVPVTLRPQPPADGPRGASTP